MNIWVGCVETTILIDRNESDKAKELRVGDIAKLLEKGSVNEEMRRGAEN